MILAAALLIQVTPAQTLDTTGPAAIGLPETFDEPVRLLPATTPGQGAWSLAAGFRGASPSLTEFIDDGTSEVTSREVIGTAIDASLGGS